VSTGQPPTDEPSSGRSRLALWVGLGVLALLLLGGGLLAGFTLIGNGGGSSGTVGVQSGISAQISNAVRSATLGTVVVPHVVGLDQARATASIEGVGLQALAHIEPSARPAGVVLTQNPRPGVRLGRGALVGLTVSAGARAGQVPSVVGLTAAAAAASLQAAGLTYVSHRVVSLRRAGLVVEQSPRAGSARPRGDVLLSVSQGPLRVTVPDVTGAARALAVRRLHAFGFPVAIRVVRSHGAAGTVVLQVPRAGSTTAQGTTVHLEVARG
jgi:eukaryotic-like serine/threonine-protein kinase